MVCCVIVLQYGLFVGCSKAIIFKWSHSKDLCIYVCTALRSWADMFACMCNTLGVEYRSNSSFLQIWSSDLSSDLRRFWIHNPQFVLHVFELCIDTKVSWSAVENDSAYKKTAGGSYCRDINTTSSFTEVIVVHPDSTLLHTTCLQSLKMALSWIYDIVILIVSHNYFCLSGSKIVIAIFHHKTFPNAGFLKIVSYVIIWSIIRLIRHTIINF